MIQVTITKNGVVTNMGQFETQELANEWLSYHEGRGTFGAKAYAEIVPVELEPAVINEDGTVAKEAVMGEQTIEHPGYVVVIEDLTAKLEQEARNAEAQKFLADTDWKVLRHRDQQELGLSTSLTGEEFQELLQQRQMARNAIIR